MLMAAQHALLRRPTCTLASLEEAGLGRAPSLGVPAPLGGHGARRSATAPHLYPRKPTSRGGWIGSGPVAGLHGARSAGHFPKCQSRAEHCGSVTRLTPNLKEEEE